VRESDYAWCESNKCYIDKCVCEQVEYICEACKFEREGLDD